MSSLTSQRSFHPPGHTANSFARAAENVLKTPIVVRQKAKLIAERQGLNYIISDGPPGIGCPVISSLSRVDLAVIVTEPTLSGMHDLDRVIGVCHHFGVPVIVCINKYDLNEDNTRQIENYCLNQGMKVVSKIPFDNVVTEALVQGLPVVEYSQNRVTHEIERLWQVVSEYLT